MRLLVAEDDPSLGIFLQRGFGAERYSVDLTQNVEQARSFGRENEYDLAILDLSLPKEEGVAVLRHLRASRQSMPILVLTNRRQITEPASELDMGADDFVVKPFAFSELSARVRALLKRGAFSGKRVARRRSGVESHGAFRETWQSCDRVDSQGILASGVSDAQCGTARNAFSDYRTRVESIA